MASALGASVASPRANERRTAQPENGHTTPDQPPATQTEAGQYQKKGDANREHEQRQDLVQVDHVADGRPAFSRTAANTRGA
jgi:hypothetical protein